MKRTILLSFAFMALALNAQTNANLSDDVVEETIVVETASEQPVMVEKGNTDISSINENGIQQEKEKSDSATLTKEEQQIQNLIKESKKQSKQLSTIKWIMVGTVALNVLCYLFMK